MGRNKMVDGVEVALTAEEETAIDAKEKAWADAEPAREMKMIRNHRNGLLTATDWTANPDVTMSSAMKTYRQMLRDIPASNTVYDDVDWGIKPA
tara:strand:+ start:640 stop:921 length:282 start_codon:yes stop_codon:yes gene_type:complete